MEPDNFVLSWELLSLTPRKHFSLGPNTYSTQIFALGFHLVVYPGVQGISLALGPNQTIHLCYYCHPGICR